mmetsp:Transcript_20565/g.51804  ORF Transcript_20565/g.51804 Transcript_20565/m.51804 type:complete len:550 (-) Transcript_20565:395-2044(-)
MTTVCVAALRSRFSLDLRALAAFRVALGGFVLFDICCRTSDTLAWYTGGEGGGPPSLLAADDTPHGFVLHRLLFYRGPWQLQAAWFAASAVMAAAFILGWRTQVVSWLLYALVAGYQGRSQHIHDGGDKLLRHLLLWSCLLPVEARCSVDAWRVPRLTSRKYKEEDGPHRERHAIGNMGRAEGGAHFSAASIGLTLQVVALYWVTAARRTGAQWWPPELSAVYYMLAGTFAASPLGNWVAASMPGLCRVLTGAGQMTEFLAPAMLLATPYTASLRLIPIIALVGLQAGIAATMWLVNFQAISVLCMLAFLPPSAMDAAAHACPAWLAALAERLGSSLARTGVRHGGGARPLPHTTAAAPPGMAELARKGLAAFLLFYLVYHSLGDMGIVSKPDGGNIGEALRFNQGWNMFASVSMEGHWWVIIGEADTVDGPMRVDLLAWLREGAAGWRALSANEDAPGFMRRPGNVASLYRNHRWERYLDQLPRQARLDSRLEHMARWLCHHAPADRLRNVEFFNFQSHIHPPGHQGEPYARPALRIHRIIPCSTVTD